MAISKSKFVLGDGETTRITLGYEAFPQVHMLIQTAFKDAAAARPGSINASSIASDVLRRLPDGSTERELLCDIMATLQPQIQEANEGKCIDPTYLPQPLQDLIQSHMGARAQLPALLAALIEQLRKELPDPSLPANSSQPSMPRAAGPSIGQSVSNVEAGTGSSSSSSSAAAPASSQAGAGAAGASAAAIGGVDGHELEALTGTVLGLQKLKDEVERMEVAARERSKHQVKAAEEHLAKLSSATAEYEAAQLALSTHMTTRQEAGYPESPQGKVTKQQQATYEQQIAAWAASADGKLWNERTTQLTRTFATASTDMEKAKLQVTQAARDSALAGHERDAKRDELYAQAYAAQSQLEQLMRQMRGSGSSSSRSAHDGSSAGAAAMPPMAPKLEHLRYTTSKGISVPAILAPTIKALLVLRTILGQLTPGQFEAIESKAHQGVGVWASEQVEKNESMAGWAARMRHYEDAAKISGRSLNAYAMCLARIADQQERNLTHHILMANPGACTIADVVAAHQQALQSITELAHIGGLGLVSSMLGGAAASGAAGGAAAGGNGAAKGGGAPKGGFVPCKWHPNSTHTLDQCKTKRPSRWKGNDGAAAAALTAVTHELHELVAMVGGGFKRTFAPNNAAAAGPNTTVGAPTPAPAGAGAGSSSGYRNRPAWPRCGTCGGAHPADRECLPIHPACGRRHLPGVECYGPGRSALGAQAARARAAAAPAAAGAAAAAAANGNGNGDYSDAAVAARAPPGCNVWGRGGGGCNVATWSLTDSVNVPEQGASSCSSSYREAGVHIGPIGSSTMPLLYGPSGSGKTTLMSLLRGFGSNNVSLTCKVAVWGDAFPDMGDEASSSSHGDLAAVADGTLKQQKPAGFYQPQPRITRASSARSLLQNIGIRSAAAVDAATPTATSGNTGKATNDSADMDGSTRMLPGNGSNMLIAVINPRTDGDFLAQLLQSGAYTSLCPTIVNVPAINMRDLLDRGVISLQTPAAATPAVLAAMAAAAAYGYQPSRGLRALGPDEETTLMFVETSAFKLYDERTGKSTSQLRLLLDSGALGALSSRQLADSNTWFWRATPGMTISAAGSPRPKVDGILQDVKLIMVPGTPHAAAVQFDALVMPGVEGTYDAILGLAQLTQLGMVVDFGTRECFMRSPVTGELVPIPVRCTRRRRLVSATSSTPVACLAVPEPERPLGKQQQQQLPLLYLDDAIYCDGGELVLLNHATGRRWRQLDYRRLNARVRQPAAAAAAAHNWAGYEEAQLMASGDINPNPGPLLGQRRLQSTWWQYCVLMLIMSALCVQAVHAFAAAVNSAPAKAMLAVAAMWVLACASLPTAATWAFMSTVVPTWWHYLQLPFRHSPTGRVCNRQPKQGGWCKAPLRVKLKSSVGFMAVLLVSLLTITATLTSAMVAGQVFIEQQAGSSLAASNIAPPTGGTGPLTTMGMFAAELYHGPHGLHPGQLLDSLQPAGGKDAHEEAYPTFTDPEGKFQFATHPLYSSSDQERLREVVRSRKHAFAYSVKEMPGYAHEVGWKLKHSDPIKDPCNARRFSPAEKQILDEKCAELEAAGLIEEIASTSPYACHPVLAAKKDAITGEWSQKRMCQDYRKLNTAMIADTYAPPLPEDIFASAAQCSVFSSLDMRSGFHQLKLDEQSKQTTAFWWGRRLMAYNRLSFGTKNATAIYQRVMDEVLRAGGCDAFAVAYVDDVLIMSADMASHVEHVAKVLDCLHAAGLRVHPEKSVFGASEIEFLGHMITPNGLAPTKAKTAAIMSLPSPRNVSELRSIMGILNYYRLYIPDFSVTAAPIYELTQAGAAWDWTAPREQAYQRLKQALCTPGVGLRAPDPEREFILHTDWSTCGLGAVLGQQDDEGNEYMVACASRSLNEHERRYTPWKGELLASVWGMKVFRHHLHGRKFTLVTDHRPLLGLLKTAEPNSQQVRWLMAVQDHDFVVRHRAGVKHINADVLSRFPQASEADTVGARMDAGPVLKPALPDVVLSDGTKLTGEHAAAQLSPTWQADMLAERASNSHVAGVAAAAAMLVSSELPEVTLAAVATPINSTAFMSPLPAPIPSWMDEYAPTAMELTGCVAYASCNPLVDADTWVEHQSNVLTATARTWVQQALPTCPINLTSQQDAHKELPAGGGDKHCMLCRHLLPMGTWRGPHNF
jgi:energy-coupling factor transporter ATP-binding protein EcfA2